MSSPPHKKYNINHKEFNRLFLESTDMTYSLGLRLFNYNEEKAKDFVQSVYLHAFERKDKFRGESKLSTWLYSVGLNYGLNEIKRSKNELNSNERIKLELEKFHKIEDNKSHDERLIEEELMSDIRGKLSELPEIYRICLILRYYEKLSYKEISKRLDLKEGTIKSHIHRGKKLLKDKIARFL